MKELRFVLLLVSLMVLAVGVAEAGVGEHSVTVGGRSRERVAPKPNSVIQDEDLYAKKAFVKWTKRFNKEYETHTELVNRYEIWKQNKEYIMKYNRFQTELTGVQLEMNEFGDISPEEFHAEYTGFGVDGQLLHLRLPQLKPAKESKIMSGLPPSVDWRAKGIVTGVKNQLKCASAWAFAAVGAVESAYARVNNLLQTLSEQHVVDCGEKYGSKGCRGGTPLNAFEFARDRGILRQLTYPYNGTQAECAYPKSSVVTTIDAFEEIPMGSEATLTRVVASVGPVAVGIDATNRAFQFYRSGIFRDYNCARNTPSHAMLLVGYGSDADKDYWILKNSFGTEWGDGGYFYLSRNEDNMCGIASAASFPVIRRIE
ncbi:Cathepsin K [Balamuthia mandrillaris]